MPCILLLNIEAISLYFLYYNTMSLYTITILLTPKDNLFKQNDPLIHLNYVEMYVYCFCLITTSRTCV